MNTNGTDGCFGATAGYPSSRSPSEVRIQWMRLYGLSRDEIIASLTDDPPTSIDDEERELDSVLAIRERNADRLKDND